MISQIVSNLKKKNQLLSLFLFFVLVKLINKKNNKRTSAVDSCEILRHQRDKIQ